MALTVCQQLRVFFAQVSEMPSSITCMHCPLSYLVMFSCGLIYKQKPVRSLELCGLCSEGLSTV